MTSFGPTLSQGHLQSVKHQLGAQVRGHGPADDPPGPGVHDHGEEEEAGVGRDVRDVAHPEFVAVLPR